ncbi:hypothetical protein BJ170DRAFT_695384 [Xylariales sp. AK1849]|nr:hypothetical protein BJ170DRAFT_695384 [Xylariales sp. AK1849]
MSSNKRFKVSIAGGGGAGLTLANMLEKFNIDYILLEAYKDIAPQVGASIGLLPNGLRILDQLGCYEELEAVALESLTHTYTRNHTSHGSPFLFFDRQWLLEILYGKLQHKDRVLLSKRVAKIKHVHEGVEVTTKDGDIFSGALIVGADGIHSAVRVEMFRAGNKIQPGYFPAGESDRVPCYYKCSKALHMMSLDDNPTRSMRSWAKGYEHIPTYTRDDEAQFAEGHFDLPITETVSWGQIYANRISSSLTPLHEIVYKKWGFQRIIALGDSAHKPKPIGGQGGNGALESAAEFVNALVQRMDNRPTGPRSLSVARSQRSSHRRKVPGKSELNRLSTGLMSIRPGMPMKNQPPQRLYGNL